MTRPFFLYFILKAFGLTLLPSYMISIFKSVILLLKELHLSCFRTLSFIRAEGLIPAVLGNALRRDKGY